jgi:16S rRNA (adenine1518-N6/adenine1519-N6)-dimethyltransferase
MKRRNLGQHYLADPEVLQEIIGAAAIRPWERVLEIGTGRGILTKELAGLGSTFEGYEVDRGNYEKTLAALKGTKARVHLGDAFEQAPRFDVLVASLPYSRSASFIGWLSTLEYSRAVVLLQEDFVRKILSAPGTRQYRAVSALAQMSSEVEVLRRVGRGSFSPPPKVSSLLVSIRPRARISEEEVSKVKRLFSLRRREVASVLAELGMAAAGDEYGRRRVYSLRPDEVRKLCSPARGI